MSGYIYAIEVGTAVKVGATTKVATRLATHRRTARVNGVLDPRSFSREEPQPFRAERRILNAIDSARIARVGEYIKAPFDDVLDIITSVPVSEPDDRPTPDPRELIAFVEDFWRERRLRRLRKAGVGAGKHLIPTSDETAIQVERVSDGLTHLTIRERDPFTLDEHAPLTVVLTELEAAGVAQALLSSQALEVAP